MWKQLNVFHRFISRITSKDLEGDALSRLCTRIKEGAQAHTGITQGTLYRDRGLHFYELGRYLERADQATRMLDIKYTALPPRGKEEKRVAELTQWNAILRGSWLPRLEALCPGHNSRPRMWCISCCVMPLARVQRCYVCAGSKRIWMIFADILALSPRRRPQSERRRYASYWWRRHLAIFSPPACMSILISCRFTCKSLPVPSAEHSFGTGGQSQRPRYKCRFKSRLAREHFTIFDCQAAGNIFVPEELGVAIGRFHSGAGATARGSQCPPVLA